jgi:hypothetical protein
MPDRGWFKHSGQFFTARILTISFSKRSRKLWASYRVIEKRDATYGTITLLCP